MYERVMTDAIEKLLTEFEPYVILSIYESVVTTVSILIMLSDSEPCVLYVFVGHMITCCSMILNLME